MPVEITAAAGEKIREVLLRRNKDPEKAALRVFVREGGCSGFAYGMSIESEPGPDDLVVEQHGVRVVVDPISAAFLRGARIDYVENLMGGGFAIHNPNAVQTCGCGQSFRTAQAEGRPQRCDEAAAQA